VDYKKISIPVKVKERVAETKDAVSFILDVPAEHAKKFIYRPGQFVTIFLDFNGEILPRSYSLCSSPLTDSDPKITIKKIAGGRGSTYLVDQVKAGDTIWVAPPAGNFYRRPMSLEPVQYGLFAAGSGITPVFSIFKSVLAASPQDSVHLVYSNRSPDDIIYSDELDALVSKYKGRVSVTHHFSGQSGRCTPEFLKDEIAKVGSSSSQFYICGPDGFMESVRLALTSVGVEDERIHQESFVSAPPLGSSEDKDPEGRVYIGDQAAGPHPEKYTLKVLLNGEEIILENQSPKTPILELLMESGANPPYSCMEGACMACMAKITEGRVYQNDPGILTDENIDGRDVLTCQAHAASPSVRIDYDNL